MQSTPQLNIGSNSVCKQEVFDALGEPEEEEEDMLDLALGLTDTYIYEARLAHTRAQIMLLASVAKVYVVARRSRLACQITVDERLQGARVILPEETDNMG